MGEFEKGQNQDKLGESEKGDKSAFQQLGDDKGEGGQQDIKTDSISTAQAKPELAGAQGAQDFGKQQGGQSLDQGKQQGGQSFDQGKQQEQGQQSGEDKQQGQDESGGKFRKEGEEGQR
jgi:hypothetical protein